MGRGEKTAGGERVREGDKAGCGRSGGGEWNLKGGECKFVGSASIREGSF